MADPETRRRGKAVSRSIYEAERRARHFKSYLVESGQWTDATEREREQYDELLRVLDRATKALEGVGG